MKKYAGVVAIVLSVCILLGTGCKNVQKEEVAEKEPLLLWSYYETEVQRNTLDEIVERFNQVQDQYELSWKYVPMTEFTRSFAIGITGEELPDLLIMDNPDMKSCIRQGMLEDLTEGLSEIPSEEYFPNIWESVLYDEKIYGLPFCCNSLVLIYNKELFDTYGVSVPQTPDELYEVSKVLASQTRSGMLLAAGGEEQGAFQFMTWLMNMGGTIEEIGGKKTEEAFAFLKQLTDEELMDVQCINWTQVDICRKFISGEAAMMLNGPWVYKMLDDSGISYGIAPIPSETESLSVIGGENIGAVKGKNKEGALAFMKFYNEDQTMYEMCKSQVTLPPKVRLAEKMAEEDKRFLQVKDMVVEGFPRTSVPNWQSISEVLTSSLKEVLLSEETPEDAAKQLQEIMTELPDS